MEKKQIYSTWLHMNPRRKTSVIWHCFSNSIQTTNINGLYDLNICVELFILQKYIAVRPAGAHSKKDLHL